MQDNFTWEGKNELFSQLSLLLSFEWSSPSGSICTHATLHVFRIHFSNSMRGTVFLWSESSKVWVLSHCCLSAVHWTQSNNVLPYISWVIMYYIEPIIHGFSQCFSHVVVNNYCWLVYYVWVWSIIGNINNFLFFFFFYLCSFRPQ